MEIFSDLNSFPASESERGNKDYIVWRKRAWGQRCLEEETLGLDYIEEGIGSGLKDKMIIINVIDSSCSWILPSWSARTSLPVVGLVCVCIMLCCMLEWLLLDSCFRCSACVSSYHQCCDQCFFTREAVRCQRLGCVLLRVDCEVSRAHIDTTSRLQGTKGRLMYQGQAVGCQG